MHPVRVDPHGPRRLSTDTLRGLLHSLAGRAADSLSAVDRALLAEGERRGLVIALVEEAPVPLQLPPPEHYR